MNAPPGPPGSRPPPGTSPSDSSAAQEVGRMISPGRRGMVANEEKMMAMAAHGLGIVTLVLGPAAIYYAYRGRSDFVKYHAYQALIWQAGVLVGGGLFTLVTCGTGSVVFVITGLLSGWVALRAWEGSWDAYPLMTELGR